MSNDSLTQLRDTIAEILPTSFCLSRSYCACTGNCFRRKADAIIEVIRQHQTQPQNSDLAGLLRVSIETAGDKMWAELPFTYSAETFEKVFEAVLDAAESDVHKKPGNLNTSEERAQSLNTSDKINRRTATVVVPDGYISVDQFARDCGLELLPSDIPGDEVERVAIAISPWYGKSISKEAVESVWEHLPADKKEGYRAQARAAITALRLPVREAGEDVKHWQQESLTWAKRAGRLHDCLNFFASVIKSGEPWTETCQLEFNKAILDNDIEGGQS